jgi:hypothetical protein
MFFRKAPGDLAPGEGCSDELDRLERLSRLVAEAAPRLRVDADLFETQLMREIQTRARGASARPRPVVTFAPWPGLGPASLAAALLVMAVCGVLAVLVGGQPVPRGGPAGVAAVTESRNTDEYEDAVTSPREIPFTVETDLVGARRGTIPLTTYVLEPPPEQSTVVRASL